MHCKRTKFVRSNSIVHLCPEGRTCLFRFDDDLRQKFRAFFIAREMDGSFQTNFLV